MLRLVLGRAGSGKSAVLLKRAAELAAEKKEVIIIVPEQASFKTERAVLAELGAADSRYVEVLSFTRLCERIFRKEGFFIGRRIDESGKTVIMNNALEAVCEELSLYKKHGRGTGLINKMLSAVTEFKTRRISPDDLKNAVVGNKTLMGKLKDISLIYAAYDAIMEQTGLDPLDDIAHACQRLENSDFFEGKTVMVDSFKSFTPLENEMLSHIMRGAQNIYVALCADSLEGSPLFAPTIRTAKSLIKIANKCCVEIAPPVYADVEQGRSQILKQLENNLFSYESVPFNGSDGVRIFSASTPYEECRLAAGEISRLVREEGYRYRDIAVVARNFDDYSTIIEDAFERASLPVFFDRREPIFNSPLIKLVFAALDIVNRGFRTEDILKYLKTDLTSTDPQQASQLENYAAIWQINGRRWREPFTLDPRGFTSQPDEEKISQTESLRIAVIAPLEELAEKLRSESCAQISAAIYEFLVKTGVPEKLDEDTVRVWDILMDMLDELAALQRSSVNAAKFSELLRLMLATADMGFIPQGLDQITAGAADRIRLDSLKAVWILGANEGVFPLPPPSGSIFSENERRMLIEKGLNMADTAEMCAEDEKMLVYMTAAAPSQRLYVSFARAQTDGTQLSRSELVDGILEVMPDVRVESDDEIPPVSMISTERSAFSEMAARWNENTPFEAALKKYFEPTDKYAALENAIKKTKLKINSQELTHKLFGDNMRVSASKVEVFHECKFKYFCRYALGIEKRRAAKLDALEYGKVVHFVFEKVFKKYDRSSLLSLTEDDLETQTLLLLDEYICENMGGWEDKTERFKYLYKRMVTLIVILLKRTAAEFAQSEFYPADCELKIGRGGDIPALMLETPNGEKLAVEGFVDRVDVMRKNGVSYVRVVDYKTGTKDFDLNDVLRGISLQMLIYLLTIDKNGESRYGEVIPSGVLYVSAKRPKSENGREAPDIPTVECQGILLDDPLVLRGMEKNLAGVFLPVKLNKDGKFSGSDRLASLEEMGELGCYIEKLLIEMANDLYDGDIDARSAHDGDPCAFCDYSAICGHEKADGGIPFEKFKRDEIFQKIREEIMTDEKDK